MNFLAVKSARPHRTHRLRSGRPAEHCFGGARYSGHHVQGMHPQIIQSASSRLIKPGGIVSPILEIFRTAVSHHGPDEQKPADRPVGKQLSGLPDIRTEHMDGGSGKLHPVPAGSLNQICSLLLIERYRLLRVQVLSRFQRLFVQLIMGRNRGQIHHDIKFTLRQQFINIGISPGNPELFHEQPYPLRLQVTAGHHLDPLVPIKIRQIGMLCNITAADNRNFPCFHSFNHPPFSGRHTSFRFPERYRQAYANLYFSNLPPRRVFLGAPANRPFSLPPHSSALYSAFLSAHEADTGTWPPPAFPISGTEAASLHIPFVRFADPRL